jgi:ABC-type antimicrobial peptide transport system ATPase subunit
MTDEDIMLEEPNKPFITIDDVQVFVEDLPEEGQQIFGRLQRLNQKKANIVLDLEELQASINFFSNRIVALYNDEESPSEETELNESTEES